MTGCEITALDDLADVVDYGVTASATQLPSGPKFLRITDIQDGSVNWGSVPWCECDSRSAKRSMLKAGDIVFARTGATTGKSFLIRECPTDAVFASYLIRVRLKPEIDPRYVAHFFQTANYWEQIARSARGAAQPGVNATTLKSLVIPVPDLNQQRRIAEVLDRAEALRAKRRAALAQLDCLIQAIFLKMFGNPGREVPNFPMFKLASILARPLQNGAYYSKEKYTLSGGVEMVHMSDAFGGVVARGNLKRVDCGAADTETYGLSTFDILLARRSLTYEGAAKPCLVPASNEPLIFESSFIRVTPDDSRLSSLYLFHYLNDELVRRRYLRPFVTQSTISGINQTNLSQVQIVVPPLSLQKSFANRIIAIETLKATQRAALAELDALFASLQHLAFRGEL